MVYQNNTKALASENRSSIVSITQGKILGEQELNGLVNTNQTQRTEESCADSDLLTLSQFLERDESKLDGPKKKKVRLGNETLLKTDRH